MNKILYFLFGWITKTKMETTNLDEFIASIEFIVIFIIGVLIYSWWVSRKK